MFTVPSRQDGLAHSPLPVHSVGILYCTSENSAAGRELEKLADCEVIEVAQAVHSSLTRSGIKAELVDLDPQNFQELLHFDWIFNLAESIYGFPLLDFEVAQRLEQLQVGFTGSGSHTLRACLDKAVTKCELIKNGIATPTFEVFQPGPGDPQPPALPTDRQADPRRWQHRHFQRFDRLDCLGIKAKGGAIHDLYRQAALVEDYIDGRDITASVLGNGADARVLPLSEITYPDCTRPRLLTFEAKWISGAPEFKRTVAVCPAHLEPKVESLIKNIALWACQVMGCRDYTRVDFRLQGRIPYVLEVNPNPCINPVNSGYVRSSMAAGLTYADMIQRIMASSIQEFHRVRQGSVQEVFV